MCRYKWDRPIKRVCLLDIINWGYSSISLDAGTINGVPILDIVLLNPFKPVKPVILRAEANFSGKAKDYRIIVEKKTSKIIRDNKSFKITVIVGDNLKAQRSALDEKNAKSIHNYEKYTKHIIHAILWHSSSYRSTTLGFTDFSNDKSYFCELILLYTKNVPICKYVTFSWNLSFGLLRALFYTHMCILPL